MIKNILKIKHDNKNWMKKKWRILMGTLLDPKALAYIGYQKINKDIYLYFLIILKESKF